MDKMNEQLKELLQAEVAKIREDLIAQVTKEVTEKVREEVTAKVREEVRAEFEEKQKELLAAQRVIPGGVNFPTMKVPPSKFQSVHAAELRDPDHYSIAAHPDLIALVQLYYTPPEDAALIDAKTLANLNEWLQSVGRHTGPHSASRPPGGVFYVNKPSEKTFSGVLSSLLQEALPDKLALCIHQQKLERGEVDVCCVIPRAVSGAWMPYPTAFVEFTLNQTSDKHDQALAYASALLQQQIESPVNSPQFDIFSPVLGIIVSPQGIEVRAYSRKFYAASDAKPENDRVVDIFVLQDNTVSWHSVVRILHSWNKQINDHLTRCEGPAAAELSSKRYCFCKNTNVAFSSDEDGDFVWKIFDRRLKPEQNERDWRSWKHYLVPDDDSEREKREATGLLTVPSSALCAPVEKLKLLRCPLIPGDHRPRTAQEFVPILRQVEFLHESNRDIVHGDIRLFNMLFVHEDTPSTPPEPWSSSPSAAFSATHQTTLIDFDFSGKENERCYPAGFNTNIWDGKRHPGAQALQPLRKEHDWFALSAVMRLFTVDSAQKPWWHNVCELVEHGRANEAIRLLPSTPIALEWGKPDENAEDLCKLKRKGTGSPGKSVGDKPSVKRAEKRKLLDKK